MRIFSLDDLYASGTGENGLSSSPLSEHSNSRTVRRELQ